MTKEELLKSLPEPDPASEQSLLFADLGHKVEEWLKPNTDRNFHLKVLLRDGTKWSTFQQSGPPGSDDITQWNKP